MLVFENVRFIFALFILFLLIIKEDGQPNFFGDFVALQAHYIKISISTEAVSHMPCMLGRSTSF